MIFTIECPTCQKSFNVSHEELAQNHSAVKCCLCGNTPTPDIMTAYQNIGKTMTELYGCCDCQPAWLPKEVKK